LKVQAGQFDEASDMKLQQPGHFAPELGPNPVLEHLRGVELTPGRQAPFSGDRFVFLHEDEQYLRAPIGQGKSLGLTKIPISKIVGISQGNLDDYSPGMTFAEVLFRCLHGASLNEASIEYLCGDAVKSDGYPGYLPFPQINGLSKVCSKYPAKGDMTFARVHDRYYADQGQQRAIVARYAIFQRFGIEGVLSNVHVFDVIPQSASTA